MASRRSLASQAGLQRSGNLSPQAPARVQAPPATLAPPQAPPKTETASSQESAAPKAPQSPAFVVTRPEWVYLSNFRGVLPKGKVLRESDYDAADWRHILGRRELLGLERAS